MKGVSNNGPSGNKDPHYQVEQKKEKYMTVRHLHIT